MPHWRKRGAIYDLEWNVLPGTYPLTMELKLFAYAVMDDHVHVLVLPEPEWPLSVIMHSWRSYSANQLQRRFGRKDDVWLTDYWNRIIRGDDEFKKRQKYIFENGLERWGIQALSV